MYQIQLALRQAKRAIQRLFFGQTNVHYNNSDLRFLISSVNSVYGIDLTQPQMSNSSAQIKQAVVCFLNETGAFKNDTALTAALWTAGVAQRGFSRRNVTHMINTMGDVTTDGQVFRAVKSNLASII